MNSPTTKSIWKLDSVDSLYSWAVGDSGLIIHTSNGGLDWQIQNAGGHENIVDVFFIDHNYGWAVSIAFDSLVRAYILSTKDGGTNWNRELFGIQDKYLNSIYFHDSLNGWIAGGPSETIYRTTNGGKSWNLPQFDSSIYSGFPIQSLAFFSKQYGFACGGLHDMIGVIWKTTNFGASWSSLNLGPEPLRKLYIIDSLNIIGVGGDFEFGTGIARSSNGGNRWIYEEPGFFGVATGLSFRKNNEAWACLSSEAKFISSSDSGQTWNIFDTPFGSQIFDVVFTDSLHGLAVGGGGVILKYIPSSLSANRDDELNVPTTNFLFQNYPNPFNPSTRIQYQVSSSTQVSLIIYDVLGNQIATLVDEYKPTGKFEVEFNSVSGIQYPASGIRSLVSGIYFYQLKIGESIQTRKMILLR